jgi:hypothetical protein
VKSAILADHAILLEAALLALVFLLALVLPAPGVRAKQWLARVPWRPGFSNRGESTWGRR